MSKTKKAPYADIQPLTQSIAALALFVASAIAAQQPFILEAEAPLFYALYNLPIALYVPFVVITHMGSIYMLGVLTVFFAAIKGYHRMIRIVMTGTLAYTLSGVAKDLWGRARPVELFGDVTSLELLVRGAGFPSGHVALATALGLTVGHYVPKKYHWLIVLWIGGVAASRMYLGVHAPLDLVGGFAIGWLSYALLRKVRLSDTAPVRRRTRSAPAKPRKRAAEA